MTGDRRESLEFAGDESELAPGDTPSPGALRAPSVSVVIPNLDSPLVGETLAALAAQGVPGAATDCEVVVVGVDSRGQVRPAAGLRLITTPQPLNPAAARNRGVAAARGRQLLFTDADCRPGRHWVPRLVDGLRSAPVVGGAVVFSCTGNLWSVADNIAAFHELLPDRPEEKATSGPLGSLNLAIRRDAWEKVGPFDEELTTSEDLDWILRARAAGLTTAFMPDAQVEHAQVRGSRTELQAHARWYGSHFLAFCRRHPGVFDAGPTWRSRRRLTLTAPLKALTSSLSIFRRHPRLWNAWRALPAVVIFKLAWYQAILESWPSGLHR